MTTMFSWLFFTCTLILLHSTVYIISFQCPESEQSSLLKLKSRVVFDHSFGTKLQSWNKTSDCCLWEGVSCDQDGHVTILDLSGWSISGTVPGEIFRMPKLESLDLSINEFLQGTLPDFPLTYPLQKLSLSLTNFSGALPESIGNLENLSSLRLFSCRFYGPLPISMQKLTKLEYLFLSGNSFSIPPTPSFRFPENLGYMDLSESGLKGEISSLHLEGLPKLKQLWLSRNFLNGSIPSSLFALPSLQGLDLSRNKFEGPLPVSIFKSGNMTSLDLSYNDFDGTVQLNSFLGFSKLRVLDLSYNRLSVDTSDRSLNSFPQVSQLRLASCNLTEFPHFKNRSNLFFLDLSSNRISGDLPNWIWENGDGFVSFLNVSHNDLTGIQEPHSLPSYLGVIDLHSNHLRGKIPSLPFSGYVDFSSNNFSSVHADVFNLSSHSLGFFSLSKNSLAGVLPQSICDLNGAGVFRDEGGVLDLSRNNFSGGIRRCIIEGSESITALNLRRNGLTGPIPDAFPGGCRFKTIDLNGNFIGGAIPKSLANCARLEVLDLGNNNLIGEFPCFLKSISTLRVLILRSNKLHGSIECPDDDSGGTWPVLQILDLARNEFGGEIPVKLLTNLRAMKNDTNGVRSKVLGATHQYSFVLPEGSVAPVYYQYAVTTVTSKGQERELPKILTSFTSIDFSSNGFRGSIPEEFDQLRALHTLGLSNNSLSGEIPSSMGNLRALESLDLSLNSLTGAIPDSFGDLNFLQFLNLSFNGLVGEVPKGSQIQTFPEDSFIGNKGLCGIPLKRKCSDHEKAPNPREEDSDEKIDWNFLSAEIGFIVGLGVVVAPIVYSRRWRILYFDRIDDIIAMVFPSAFARKWIQWTNTH